MGHWVVALYKGRWALRTRRGDGVEHGRTREFARGRRVGEIGLMAVKFGSPFKFWPTPMGCEGSITRVGAMGSALSLWGMRYRVCKVGFN